MWSGSVDPFLEFYTPCKISETANARDFKFCTRVGHAKSESCDEWVFPKWAWSGSREQFLHCRLRKFRHNKSSVYRWYTQLDRRRFVYDTWDNGSRFGRVMVECTLSITHCLRLNLQLHTIDLVRTCRISSLRISSFCTVASQLARFQLTRRIPRSLGDSWASCLFLQATPLLPHGVTIVCYLPCLDSV